MSGNEDAMKLVNAVTFAEMLDGGADILLEVHLYEVDKTHTQNIGAQLPTSAGIFSIAAEAQSIVTANQSILQQAIAAGLLTLSGSPLNQLEQELGFLIASGAVSLPQVSGLLGIFGNGLTLAGLFLGSSSTFNLLLNSTDTHMLDAVQMRVGDNKDATFRSGTRYPITTFDLFERRPQFAHLRALRCKNQRPAGQRPALAVSRQRFNGNSPTDPVRRLSV